jgi:hypothetical protein
MRAITAELGRGRGEMGSMNPDCIMVRGCRVPCAISFLRRAQSSKAKQRTAVPEIPSLRTGQLASERRRTRGHAIRPGTERRRVDPVQPSQPAASANESVCHAGGFGWLRTHDIVITAPDATRVEPCRHFRRFSFMRAGKTRNTMTIQYPFRGTINGITSHVK